VRPRSIRRTINTAANSVQCWPWDKPRHVWTVRCRPAYLRLITFACFIILLSTFWITVISRFASLIRSSKSARKAKTRKTKIIFREEAPGKTIGLLEEGARVSENWPVKQVLICASRISENS
jgi:hypothetical protein